MAQFLVIKLPDSETDSIFSNFVNTAEQYPPVYSEHSLDQTVSVNVTQPTRTQPGLESGLVGVPCMDLGTGRSRSDD